MKKPTKYFLSMAAGLVAYALGLVLLNYFYPAAQGYRYALILLPVLPLIYTAAVIVRVISELDEMWRKVLTEAMAFSAIATGFSCFSYLFVRDMGGPEFRGEWAFYLMWIYYGIGTWVSVRRYQ